MEKYVYHGSPEGGLSVLRPTVSTHLKSYVYATTNPAIALAFTAKGHGDLDSDLRIVDGKVVLTERREGALDVYKRGGYLYTLDATNFKHQEGLWSGEVVSESEEKILSCEFIPNILEKMNEYVQRGELVIYRYPEKPEFIPKDDSDLIEKYIRFDKMGHRGAIDGLVRLFPHLKDKVFSMLETPSEFYYVDVKRDSFDSIVASDNPSSALTRENSPVFVRENGELSYNVVDSRIVFEKGGFNLNEDIYIYKVKGNYQRLSAHDFKVDNVQIVSCEKFELEKDTGLKL